MSASTDPPPEREPLPPHSPLTAYYDEERARHRYVMDLFDRTAHHYNTIERVFLNGGLTYRRLSLKRAGLRRGMKVLDVAMGTAAVAQGAERLVGSEGRVFGVDPNPSMIREARKVFHGPVTRGIATELPFKSDHFDFVTMGIALRHVADLEATFREYLRVLEPGGTLWILEGHVPTSRLGHSLTRFAWKQLIPGLTWIFTRDREAKLLMDYYWDTVEQCVPPDTIVKALGNAGFENPSFKVVVPGAFCEYSGKKPQTES